mmetsp:Transcript_37801/g.58806  ORF Transcript_37801/g.58806 Transcript_37801/m.58806 type:complete len:514 (+) Transcript_37801:75-1616(+)
MVQRVHSTRRRHSTAPPCPPPPAGGPFPAVSQARPDTGPGGTAVLGHEPLVEGLQLRAHLGELGLLGEDGGADVEGAGLLAEARAWNGADARGPQQFQAVEHIRGLAGGRGGRDGAGGQVDLGEGVHGPVRLLAGHALHGVERVRDQPCPTGHGGQDLPVLAEVTLIGRLPRLGRVDHDAHDDLAGHRGAQVDRGQLEPLLLGAGVDVVQLEVAAAPAALAVGALRDRVEADQLALRRVPPAHVVQHLLHGDEGPLALVHVLLVHLVRQEHYVARVAELHQVHQVLVGQAVAGGVARVDEDHAAHGHAPGAGVGVRALQLGQVERPPALLVQLVPAEGAPVEADGCRVERVGRHGRQKPVLLPADHRPQYIPRGLGGAVGEEDLVRVGRVPVAPLDELRHLLADVGRAVGGRVGADAALNVVDVQLRAGHLVRLEHLRGRGVLHEVWRRHQRHHVADVGDRCLAKLLGVADIGEHHLFPRQHSLLGRLEQLTRHRHVGSPQPFVQFLEGQYFS